MLEFPEEAGYPVGGDFPIKYYLIEMHYANPKLYSGKIAVCLFSDLLDMLFKVIEIVLVFVFMLGMNFVNMISAF
jgi:hypothetical protein